MFKRDGNSAANCGELVTFSAFPERASRDAVSAPGAFAWGREIEGYCVMVLHWTGDRNRRTGTDVAADIIRQAESIEQKTPRVVPFRPARFLGSDTTDGKPSSEETRQTEPNSAETKQKETVSD